ncbi:uncharacterized protein LOC144434634 [Glandiceps talaboti]
MSYNYSELQHSATMEVKTLIMRVFRKGQNQEKSENIEHIETDHMLNVLTEFQNTSPDTCVEVKYCGGSKEEMRYWFDKRTQLDCIWSEQSGIGLGDRMANAFKQAFEEGAENVIIVQIGGDIPGIDCEILQETIESLQDVQHQEKLLLGPAHDGGYYLIGLNRLHMIKLDDMLANIDWGTGKVREQQEKRANSLGISVRNLSKVLQDVDTIEDFPVVTEFISLTKQQIVTPKLSVIIPTLNEINNIGKALETVLQKCTWPEYMEVLVCDGGSDDGTVQIVEEMACSEPRSPVRLVKCPRGRGKQQSIGVHQSSGDILLFLHADTTLPDIYFEHILMTLVTPGVSAGAFQFDLDKLNSNSYPPRLLSWTLRFVRWGTNLRVKWFELPYGDQALFMTRKMIDKIGGFPTFPLMEDYHLVKQLQREGHIKIAESSVLTSALRWEKYGYRNTIRNTFIILAYQMGVKPTTLATWYYGNKAIEKDK